MKYRTYDVWVWDRLFKDVCLGAFTVTALCKLHAKKMITDIIKKQGHAVNTYRIVVNRAK